MGGGRGGKGGKREEREDWTEDKGKGWTWMTMKGEDKGRGVVGMEEGKKGKSGGRRESERKRREMRRKERDEVFKMGRN